MADSNIIIAIKSDGSGARVIKRDLDEIANKSDKTTNRVNVLKSAFVGLAGVLSVRAFSQFADNITVLDTKLKNVTGTQKEANKIFNQLFEIAQKNGDGIDGLADSYTKLNIALPDTLKRSTDLVKVTELLSRGLSASGAGVQQVQGTLLQLNQALAGNFESSAQELNSLIEGAPLLAKVIAEELGGTSAVSLKRFAEAGDLTAESFLNALLRSEEAIKAFVIPETIGRSVQRISNEFVRLGKESEQLRAVSGLISSALNLLASNLDTIIKSITVLTITSLPLLIGLFAKSLPAALTATTAGFVALNAVILANPFVAAATAISAVVSALFVFRREIFETFRDIKFFGVDVTDVFFGIKNTAIEVFSSLINTITLPFRIAINVIKSEFAKLKVFAFQALDFSNRNLGTDFSLNFLSGRDIELSRQNIAQIATNTAKETFIDNAGLFDRAVQNTRKDIADFAKITDETGLSDTGEGNPPSTPPIIEVLKDAAKESKKTGKEISESLKEATEDFGDGIIDAFRRGFEGGEGFIGRFTGGLQNAFQNLMADVVRVAGSSVLQGVAGASAGGGLGALASGGGGGGFGNIGSLLSNGFSAFSSGLSAPIFGAGSFVGSGINSIGASLGLTNANFIGPVLPGTSSLASAFTPAAGIAGFGGNLLGDLIFGGDRGIGSTIGGAAGGVVGTAIGANLGTILGFAGGPAGALIGAFAGNALGGLFGGAKPSNKTQFTGLNLDTLETRETGLTGKKFSQENRDFANAVIDEASSLAQLLKSSGASLSGNVGVTIGSRDGIRAGTGGYNSGRNFGSNSDALIEEVARLVVESITDAPEDLKTVLSNVSGFDTKSVAEAIGILELVRSFEDAGDAARPLGDALDSLDAQFKELADKAKALGLPTDKLTESYEKQKDALIKNVLSPLQQFLDQQALSSSSTLAPSQRLSLARSAFDENLSNIQSGDFTNLSQITSQATQLLSIGRDIFASGEGFAALESFVRQSVSGIAGDLGAAGGLNDSVAREISIGNAQQISIQEQMLLQLRELNAENTRLRKAMERMGNQMVIQS